MAGEELLIAENDDRDREGLRKLFEDQGYVVTAPASVAAAEELVQRKFFAAALLDLDFGGTGGGLALARFVEQHSRPTRLVLLTGRRSFEDAVEALRLGVLDIVSKRPDQIQYLMAAVRRASDLAQSGGDKRGALMTDLRVLLEDALKIMFTMARKQYGGDSTSGAGVSIKPAILVIDEDQAFLKQVAELLADKSWDVSVELSGGSGLDRASTFSFQIVAVRKELMDLPGELVLKSAQAQQTQMMGLVYSLGSPGMPGRAERYENGRPHKKWSFASAMDLVRCLDELVAEIASRREERRYMQVFRSEHGAFLKRFADLKARVDALSD
jgi:DNA-binding NtrC family response regulator